MSNPETTESRRLASAEWRRELHWLEESRSLIRRLVPTAETWEVQEAAERIVAQLQGVWMHHV